MAYRRKELVEALHRLMKGIMPILRLLWIIAMVIALLLVLSLMAVIGLNEYYEWPPILNNN
jgi:hypothetical protein